jgi:hypothetical protein
MNTTSRGNAALYVVLVVQLVLAAVYLVANLDRFLAGWPGFTAGIRALGQLVLGAG